MVGRTAAASADATRDGERDGPETVPAQKRGSHGPETGVSIVETERHRPPAGMHAIPHEAVDRLRGHCR